MFILLVEEDWLICAKKIGPVDVFVAGFSCKDYSKLNIDHIACRTAMLTNQKDSQPLIGFYR